MRPQQRRLRRHRHHHRRRRSAIPSPPVVRVSQSAADALRGAEDADGSPWRVCVRPASK